MSVSWRHPSRRDMILGGGALACLASATRRAGGQTGAHTTDGFRIIRARPGSARLRGPDREATTIWGFDSGVPGPAIRLKRGEEARIRLVNELPEATTLHWHGVRIASAMDGAPHLTQSPIAPGDSCDYRFACPDAGTFWYHAPYGVPAQCGRGLSGPLLVEESEPVGVDQDVALILGVWRLRPDGSIDDARFPGQAPLSSDQVTANGVPALEIPVQTNERVRLRLINAASVVLSVTLDRHRATVMALDGQPAEPFVARDSRVFLGPGNRTDLFVDALLEAGASAPIRIATEAGAVAIARLTYRAAPPVRPAARPDPVPLPANPLPQRMDFAGALKLDLPIGGPATKQPSRWRREPAAGTPEQPLFSVRRGRTVMLAFANRTDAAAVAHVHGHAFRLLDRLDDGWKPFWLDTLVVPERQILRIAFVADNPGKWLIEAGAPAFQATPIWAWFEVT